MTDMLVSGAVNSIIALCTRDQRVPPPAGTPEGNGVTPLSFGTAR